MSAEDFYKEYYPSKMHLFRDKSDRQLQIFGIDDMINFADEYHKNKKLNKQTMEENKVFYCYEVSEQYLDICEKQCVICRSKQRHDDNLNK